MLPPWTLCLPFRGGHGHLRRRTGSTRYPISSGAEKARDQGSFGTSLGFHRRPAAQLAVLACNRTQPQAGRKLLSSQPGCDRSQTLYAGLVKEREALHDSNLYPVYLAHAARLAEQGATVRRVVLDFELKQMYLRELRRREAEAKELRHSPPEAELKRAVAAQFDLPVLDGKVQFPDLRIEYEMPGLGPAKADIELATASYHHRHLAQKTRAGFTVYADPGERAQLGPGIRDDHDLMAGILSF